MASTIYKKCLHNIYFLLFIISRRSPCASPICRPRFRLGLQSLGLAQKDSLLLLMI
jgi:hypothetical protein